MYFVLFFFFKQKTAYEMRISDWSSDVCSSDLSTPPPGVNLLHDRAMAGYRGTGVTTNAQGVQELSTMVDVPATGWFVVARIPTEVALRPVNELRRDRKSVV